MVPFISATSIQLSNYVDKKLLNSHQKVHYFPLQSPNKVHLPQPKKQQTISHFLRVLFHNHHHSSSSSPSLPPYTMIKKHMQKPNFTTPHSPVSFFFRYTFQHSNIKNHDSTDVSQPLSKMLPIHSYIFYHISITYTKNKLNILFLFQICKKKIIT